MIHRQKGCRSHASPLRTRIPVTSATIMPVRIAITTSAALTPFGPIFVLPNEQLPCWKRIVDDLTVEAFRVLDSDVQRRGHVDALLREILAAFACRGALVGVADQQRARQPGPALP